MLQVVPHVFRLPFLPIRVRGIFSYLLAMKWIVSIPMYHQLSNSGDGDGFCEVHVNTMEGFWSLLRSWLRPHRGISQEKLPLYLGFFEFVHNVRKRGKALLGALIELLVS